MLNKLNIGNKLALIMIAFSVVVTAFLSASYYLQFDRALRERVLLQLSSVKQLKKLKIIAEIKDHISSFENWKGGEPLPGADQIFSFRQWPKELLDFELPNNLNPDDTTRLLDITHYSKSRNVTIALYKKVGDSIKIGIAELPEIQEILLERTGLGETGESYLVDANYSLLTQSRFENPSNETIVKTEGVMRALRGDPGKGAFTDYRGVQVFSAYDLINLNGLKWAMLSEINAEEALAPIQKLRNNLFFILIIIFLFILIASYYLSNLLVRPIVKMEKKLIQMSKGVLEKVSTETKRTDEIGHMFEAHNKLVRALTDTIAFADEIGDGNFDATYESMGPDDNLGEALMKMQEKLRAYQHTEQRLLRENQASLLNGEEKERSRLAKELHDGLGPLLTTLRIDIQKTRLNAETKKLLLNNIDETILEVRDMSNNLMPSVLKDFGAGEAIGNLSSRLRDTSKIEIHFKNDMSNPRRISDEVHITLYRITQEALNNAIKHSSASRINVSITEFTDLLSLFISDNGIGFNSAESGMGNGIRNMTERVKLANGHLEIKSDQTGTAIEVEIPLL